MDDLELMMQAALDQGFTHAGPMEASTLKFRPEVRQMCAADRCQMYGRTWACPPGCGSLEDMEERVKGYYRGFIVETVGQLEDDFDYETMLETEKLHNASFQRLIPVVRKIFPRAIPMAAGSCTRCEECTYPDAPCRFPELVWPSMEACGLIVSDVCRDNGMKYNHGKGTICFISCFLTD